MGLTPQQVKAVQLLAKGRSQQEVADMVGVSRRTVSRWLQSPEFKNLSFGLVNQPQPQPQPQPNRERRGTLTPQDLVEDVLRAIQDILTNPDSRSCDRLKAAALIGDWAGLSQRKPPMHEMEGLEAMIRAGWVPDEVLDALIDGSDELAARVKDAFVGCFENGKKKSLPQDSLNPERGTVVEIDADIDDDDFDDLK